MLLSLALIFLVGLTAAGLCARIGIPRIIGMLLTGVILGPFAADALAPEILNISSELRRIALIIILIKAGLSLDLSDLKKIGRPAVLMSMLPALFEIGAWTAFAPMLLSVTRIEAAIMGSVLGAVSPAVVIPRMVYLMDHAIGTKKRIPQLLLAGSSLDDVFVIVLFSTFVRTAQGEAASAADFAGIPVSIVLGIGLGVLAGWLLALLFEYLYVRKSMVRNSVKVIIVLACSFLLMSVEDALEGIVPVSGLLAVMSMAAMLARKCAPAVRTRLSAKFGKLWLSAEVILFVLVGAAVDIRFTLKAGPAAILMLFIGLLIRSIGVAISLLGTELDRKERLFCIIAYLPKATVQAAIGGVPLALGLPCGNLVLSVAVLSILITAPLGAFGIDKTQRRLL